MVMNATDDRPVSSLDNRLRSAPTAKFALVEVRIMGILEVHFHDSRFEWNINPGTEEERSLSFGVGSESNEATTDGGTGGRPSVAPKLRSFAIVALVVGAGIAFNRLRSRRAREEAEQESRGRRLSLSRSK